jgi:hypothetical protein
MFCPKAEDRDARGTASKISLSMTSDSFSSNSWPQMLSNMMQVYAWQCERGVRAGQCEDDGVRGRQHEGRAGQNEQGGVRKAA